MVAPVGMPSPCGEADAGPLKVRQRISAFSPGKRRAASSEISAAMAKSSSCRRQPGNELEIAQQRRHARERPGDSLDTEAAPLEPALAQQIGERLRPLRAHR